MPSVHEPATGRALGLMGQLLAVTAKSPWGVTLPMTSAVVPVLLRVTLWAALVLPMFWRPKLWLAGANVTMGASAKLADTVLPMSMVSVQVGCAPAWAQAPPQVVRLAAGVAVKVT